MRSLYVRVGLAALILGAAVTDALATGVVTETPAPEINPATLSGGLALLAGGILLARARWRR
jgi:hypothetical protein